MKITICGSMYFAKEMIEIKKKLEVMGHNVFTTSTLDDCFKIPKPNMDDLEYCLSKNVPKEDYNNIAKSDAILVLNYEKSGINGYVGGAVLMEIAVALHLNKKIFLLYSPPKTQDLKYSLEIQLAKPIILNGDLGLIL